MGHGTSRYVRVYQDGEKIRSIGGLMGNLAVREFWDHHNPRYPIVKDYQRIKQITGHDADGNIIEDEVRLLMFPKQYIDCPDLIKCRSDNKLENYSGLIYLVEISKRSKDHRRIRNIYIAEYITGRLNSMTKLHAAEKIWFKDGELGFVEVAKGHSTIYTVAVYSPTKSTKIPMMIDKHLIFDENGDIAGAANPSAKKLAEKPKAEMKVKKQTQTAGTSWDDVISWDDIRKDLFTEKEIKESDERVRVITNALLHNHRYPIITLCGSTKFKKEFIEAYENLSLDGNVVLSVCCFSHADHRYDIDVTPEMKMRLDDMHRHKISMSDMICVINVDDYIGESTRSEIEFAKQSGIPVYYYFPHIE